MINKTMLSTIISGYTVPVHAFLVAAIFLIIIYGLILRKFGLCDILEGKIIDRPELMLDGWGVTHILFFMLLGFTYSGHPIAILIVGALWECIETILGQNKFMIGKNRLQLVGDQDRDGRPTGDTEAYWYGRSSDVLMNSIGYMFGEHIKKK